MVSIFPYWEQVATLEDAYSVFRSHFGQVFTSTLPYGKDIWLGGTGWPSNDANVADRNPNNVASPENAKQYFDTIGCQVLNGNGSGFYHVDRDQHATASARPQFGLLDVAGNVLNGIDTTCAAFSPQPDPPIWLPKFAGGPTGL